MAIQNAPPTSIPGSKSLLVVGGYGVVGNAIVEVAVQDPGIEVITASRRRAPERLVNGARAPRHLSVDLADLESVVEAFVDLPRTLDIAYAAYVHHADPVASVRENVGYLSHTLEALRRADKTVGHIVLIGGGKSYGPHLGPYKTPAKESDSRIIGPIFYNDQEDYIRIWAQANGASWTVLRPDGIAGASIGAPMNLVQSLGVYAAIHKELGLPLRFPGKLSTWSSVLHQLTDSTILGKAVLWALRSPESAGEIFNVTNGDLFRWEYLWKDIANHFQMAVDVPQPMPLSVQMADKRDVWDRIVKKHQLRPTPYDEIASWPFVDVLLGVEFDMVQSTVKIRQAGFHECLDTHAGVVNQLSRLREAKLLP